MRVLVTGGAGFIGSHVVEALLEAGHEVVVVDNLSRGQREHVPPAAELLVADVLDPGAWQPQVGHADAMIHLAAQVSVKASEDDPLQDFSVNVGGTLTVLEAARALNVREIRFASSAAVYGDPLNIPTDEDERAEPLSHYGLNKWVAEQYLSYYHRVRGLNVTVLRLANVYGPRQRAEGEGGVVAVFCAAAAQGRALRIEGDGHQTRDFVYVGDVARAFCHRLGEVWTQGIYNIATARETSVLELARRVLAMSEHEAVDLRYGPKRPQDIARSALKTDRARAWGFFADTPLEQGLRATYHYFLHHYRR